MSDPCSACSSAADDRDTYRCPKHSAAGRIMAIDPGPTQSAFLVLRGDGPTIDDFGIIENVDLAIRLAHGFPNIGSRLAIEWVSFYGKEIHPGSETFHTCRWVGRFQEAWGDDATCTLIERRAVRSALCGTMKAGDAEVRAVLIDRYGGKEKAIGKKKTPGPLYGITSHVWSALAVAVVYADRQLASRAVVASVAPMDDSDIPF